MEKDPGWTDGRDAHFLERNVYLFWEKTKKGKVQN